MEVRAYEPGLAEAWDRFNRGARNGHFMFDRAYMDYHADRFRDGSVMLFEGEALIGLLPANLTDDLVWSHQGLTFGGLVVERAGTAQVLAMLDACAAWFKCRGAGQLVYKALPWIYHRAPAQEDLYWLFRRQAQLVRRDVTAAIDYRSPGPQSGRRRRGVAKARAAGVTFEKSEDFAPYWALLKEVLGARHGASPVHSLAEIERLAAAFPNEIALHVAKLEGRLLAGVVMYSTPQVAHAQYIASGEEGRALGALDGLFQHLVETHVASCRYFDFGISNTDQGQVLNEGLIRQKEEFGASAAVHDFYKVEL